MAISLIEDGYNAFSFTETFEDRYQSGFLAGGTPAYTESFRQIWINKQKVFFDAGGLFSISVGSTTAINLSLQTKNLIPVNNPAFVIRFGEKLWSTLNHSMAVKFYYYDADLLVKVPYGSVIGVSSDGGLSWSLLSNLSEFLPFGVNPVFCVDDATGVVVGKTETNDLKYSNNGGSSWVLSYSRPSIVPGGPTYEIVSIAKSADKWIALQRNPNGFITSTNLSTWSAVSFPNTLTFTPTHIAVSGNYFYAYSASAGKLFKSNLDFSGGVVYTWGTMFPQSVNGGFLVGAVGPHPVYSSWSGAYYYLNYIDAAKNDNIQGYFPVIDTRLVLGGTVTGAFPIVTRGVNLNGVFYCIAGRVGGTAAALRSVYAFKLNPDFPSALSSTPPAPPPPPPVAPLVITQRTDITLNTGSTVNIGLTLGGGNSPYVWSASNLPAGLSLSHSGTNVATISGTCSESSGVTKAVLITASDSTTPTAMTDTMLFNIAVSSAYSAISITPRSLPNAPVGKIFSQLFSVTGTTNPITWSAPSMNVPGLTFFASTGNLRGTPTTAGNYNIVIEAVDSFSVPMARDSVTMTLKVFKVLLEEYLTGLVTVIIDVNYSSGNSFRASGSPDGNYSWTASGLPPGLSIAALASNPAIGQISGKVPAGTSPRSYEVLVIVSSGTSTASARFFYNVVMPEGSPLTAYNDSVDVKFNTPIEIDVLLNDTGDGIFIFGNTAPTNGTLSVIPWTGAVPVNVKTYSLFKYTPNKDYSGSDSFTYTLKDNTGATSQGTVTITVAEPEAIDGPVINNLPASPVAIDMDSSYEYTFTALGGVVPLTWQASGLPAGLTLSTGGVITGVATTAGDYNATITVTDSQLTPKPDSKPLTFVVVNVYTATIQGTLRLDTSVGAFAARTVYLYNYTTGDKVASTTSDGATGAWSFTQVAPGDYFVVGAAQGDDLNIPRDFDALGVITVV
jgi:hypothetical protein